MRKFFRVLYLKEHSTGQINLLCYIMERFISNVALIYVTLKRVNFIVFFLMNIVYYLSLFETTFVNINYINATCNFHNFDCSPKTK